MTVASTKYLPKCLCSLDLDESGIYLSQNELAEAVSYAGLLSIAYKTINTAYEVCLKTKKTVQIYNIGKNFTCFEIGDVWIRGSFKSIRNGILWDRLNDTAKVAVIATCYFYNFSKPDLMRKRMENHRKLLPILDQAEDLFIKTYAAIQHPDQSRFSFIQERYDGDLYTFTQKYASRTRLERRIDMCIQLLEQVKYLHAHGLVHQDIKLENIVFKFDGFVTKLIDFDDVISVTGGELFNIGTPHYYPPEVWRSLIEPDLNPELYRKERDIWALGIVSIYLIHPDAFLAWEPSDEKTENEFDSFVECLKKSKKPPIDALSQYLEKHKDLAPLGVIGVEGIIRNMLCYDPTERISAEEAYRSFYGKS